MRAVVPNSSHQRLFCIPSSLSKGAKYGTPQTRMAFCHLQCNRRWSSNFYGLGVILAVMQMTPLIATPIGVALRIGISNKSTSITHFLMESSLNLFISFNLRDFKMPHILLTFALSMVSNMPLGHVLRNYTLPYLVRALPIQ